MEGRPVCEEQNGQAREWSKTKPEGDTCVSWGGFYSDIGSHRKHLSMEMT